MKKTERFNKEGDLVVTLKMNYCEFITLTQIVNNYKFLVEKALGRTRTPAEWDFTEQFKKCEM